MTHRNSKPASSQPLVEILDGIQDAHASLLGRRDCSDALMILASLSVKVHALLGQDAPKVGRRWVIRFPDPTPSENEIRGWHWRHVREMKVETAWKFKAALNRIPVIPKADGFRKVTICRFGPGVLDSDNLAGGAKALVDAIKGEGLIMDDSPFHCRLEFIQKVSRKDSHTEIVIEEAA